MLCSESDPFKEIFAAGGVQLLCTCRARTPGSDRARDGGSGSTAELPTATVAIPRNVPGNLKEAQGLIIMMFSDHI